MVDGMKSTAKLDDKLWIWGYKPGSKSALALANALDVWCIKHEGSNFKGTADKVILNWGAGTGYFCPNPGTAKVLNLPTQVDQAVNKLSFFRAMRGWEAPRLPYWTQNEGTAQGWVSSGLEVVARTKLEGMKGDGIVLIKTPNDFVEASLYTVKVPSIEEYRVYCLNGQAIDARIKLPNDQALDGLLVNVMRYNDAVWEFCKLPHKLPADVAIQAERAIKKIGLFTGGVDVLWDGKLATVLEINTAPYLGGDTADLYAEGIKKYLGY